MVKKKKRKIDEAFKEKEKLMNLIKKEMKKIL